LSPQKMYHYLLLLILVFLLPGILLFLLLFSVLVAEKVSEKVSRLFDFQSPKSWETFFETSELHSPPFLELHSVHCVAISERRFVAPGKKKYGQKSLSSSKKVGFSEVQDKVCR